MKKKIPKNYFPIKGDSTPRNVPSYNEPTIDNTGFDNKGNGQPNISPQNGNLPNPQFSIFPEENPASIKSSVGNTCLKKEISNCPFIQNNLSLNSVQYINIVQASENNNFKNGLTKQYIEQKVEESLPKVSSPDVLINDGINPEIRVNLISIGSNQSSMKYLNSNGNIEEDKRNLYESVRRLGWPSSKIEFIDRNLSFIIPKKNSQNYPEEGAFSRLPEIDSKNFIHCSQLAREISTKENAQIINTTPHPYQSKNLRGTLEPIKLNGENNKAKVLIVENIGLVEFIVHKKHFFPKTGNGNSPILSNIKEHNNLMQEFQNFCSLANDASQIVNKNYNFDKAQNDSITLPVKLASENHIELMGYSIKEIFKNFKNVEQLPSNKKDILVGRVLMKREPEKIPQIKNEKVNLSPTKKTS